VPMEAPGVVSVHARADVLFVGFNAGEWGGGLVRIDRRDGKVRKISSIASGDVCGGPLDARCHPVNGIVDEPWDPACVVVTIGLEHMMTHGRIVEVCGNTVKRLYVTPLHVDPRIDAYLQSKSRGGEPLSTVAFYGLQRVGDALWAAGNDGLYRIDQRGAG